MSTTGWVILCVVAFDLVIVFFLIRGIAQSQLGQLAKQFPPLEPDPRNPNTETRRYQSFSFGLLNLGWSIRVTLDTTHLHLRPEAWMRWIGVPATSLPRELLEPQGSRKGSLWAHPIRVEAGTRVPQVIRGPRWLWEELGGDAAAA